jgi:hypothetical protein
MTECDGRAEQRNVTLNVIASGSEAIYHERKGVIVQCEPKAIDLNRDMFGIPFLESGLLRCRSQ